MCMGFCSLGQELDISDPFYVILWTWTEKFLQIFLHPPPTLPENPEYIHQSDHCPRPVIDIGKIYN